jgi:aminoglycoside phosphotransferase (APT) family kinase protein
VAALVERGIERSGAEDERALRALLERIVADRFGSRASIAQVQRERFRWIGSYDCETLTVDLQGGERLALFFKDFGFSRLSKDDRELRRARELRVYRDLLAQADLGTPRYYGSLWDEARGRYWLLLELVEGTVVEEVDLRFGAPAAAWLARLQGHFLHRPKLLARCEFLIRHDAAFFRSKAESARRDVARLAPCCAPRLAAVLARYDRAVERMASQPQSLVHGGYIPWHVLVEGGREPARVCAVDWELAALGATLYDLAFFTDGVASPVRERIWEAYRAAAEEHEVPVPDGAELRRVIDCFRLHRILDWLARSVEKGFPERKVTALVDRAEELGRLVLD